MLNTYPVMFERKSKKKTKAKFGKRLWYWYYNSQSERHASTVFDSPGAKQCTKIDLEQLGKDGIHGSWVKEKNPSETFDALIHFLGYL